MEIIGGLVGGGNLLLSVVIGVRLLWLARTTPDGPEIWLALYFLLAAFLGMGLSNFVYMSWTDSAVTLSDGLTTLLNALYIFGTTAGMGCLYVFTWRTFRPREGWARALVTCVVVVMIGGYAATGLSGDFVLSLVPGAAYWVTWAARTWVFAWLLIESFRYAAALRRRLRLGLADPLIANRFLLWGVWSATMLLMGHIDPIGRMWYVANIGDTAQWVPEQGRHIVLVLVTASSALGTVVMTTLYLTFFPTQAYRRWIASSSGVVGEPAEGA